MDLFPGMGPAMNRITGVEQLMGSVADHREKQRSNSLQPNEALPMK